MTELNQSTLRGILALITSVNEANIVPKQGNWWNPQNAANKPDTWCAYLIKSNQPRTAPFYHASDNGQSNAAVVEKIATIDLQFVGPQAEAIANNVATWPLRGDVQNALKTVGGSLLYDDMTARSSNFMQDGTNTVLAWNVTIRILWYQVVETNQSKVMTINVGGHINV